MRQDHDYDEREYSPPYRKPSTSAVVAAVAVAFAVFVLGGFIKTYRQLENLKVESKREIQQLRESVALLRKNPAGQSQARRTGDERGRTPSRASTARRASTPTPDPARSDFPNLDTMVSDELLACDDNPTPARGPRINASSGISGLIAMDGRQSSPDAAFDVRAVAPRAAAASEPKRIHVITVNNSQKRLMVEGGRDHGFAEGSRLELSRGGSWIGDLRVVEVFDNISACEFVHCKQTPEPGDLVRLRVDPPS